MVPAELVRSTIEALKLLDEFFRLHARGITRAGLRAFGTGARLDPSKARLSSSKASALTRSVSPNGTNSYTG
jgi:hypothetical protein